MSHSPEEILETLEETRLTWWLYSTLCRVVVVVIGSLLVFTLLVFVEVIANLPNIALRFGYVIWATSSVGSLLGVLYFAAQKQRSLAATARRIEMTFPHLDNSLISLVQFSERPLDASYPYVVAAMEEAARLLDATPLDGVSASQTRWRRFQLSLQTRGDFIEHLATLAFLFVLLYGLSVSPSWSTATNRLLNVWTASESTMPDAHVRRV